MVKHMKAESVAAKHLPAKEKFWSLVDTSGGADACWPWLGATKNGYGTMTSRGIKYYCHRFAWTEARGPIPDGLHVLHYCDNPPCCNAAHLFLGTQADNMADKEAKGRGGQLRGEERPDAIVTVPQVLEIRRLYDAGVRPLDRIGKLFGITGHQAGVIGRRQQWRSVPETHQRESVAAS